LFKGEDIHAQSTRKSQIAAGELSASHLDQLVPPLARAKKSDDEWVTAIKAKYDEAFKGDEAGDNIVKTGKTFQQLSNLKGFGSQGWACEQSGGSQTIAEGKLVAAVDLNGVSFYKAEEVGDAIMKFGIADSSLVKLKGWSGTDTVTLSLEVDGADKDVVLNCPMGADFCSLLDEIAEEGHEEGVPTTAAEAVIETHHEGKRSSDRPKLSGVDKKVSAAPEGGDAAPPADAPPADAPAADAPAADTPAADAPADAPAADGGDAAPAPDA
jgi:hypothetical protein